MVKIVGIRDQVSWSWFIWGNNVPITIEVIGIKEGDRDQVDVDHTIIDVNCISILIGCLVITVYFDVDRTLFDHNYVSWSRPV